MPISKQKGATDLGVKFELAYGVGSVGSAIFVIAPQILLLYFMIEALAIPPAAAGLALLFPKLVEFFTDPLIGRWSDRVQSRWGRRRPFMAVGSVFFLIGFVALFTPPDFSHWHNSLAWVLITFACAGLCLAVVGFYYPDDFSECELSAADLLQQVLAR